MPAFATSELLGTPSSAGGDPVSTTDAIGTAAAALEAIGAGAADSLSRKGEDVDDGATIAATAKPPMSAAATAPVQRARTRSRLGGTGALAPSAAPA
jgi:hypothetical protein